MAGLDSALLVLALLALAALPAEIRLLARHRNRVKARIFLRYREYVRLWVVAGAILTPGFFSLFIAAILDQVEPAWPFGILSLGAMGMGLYGCTGVLWALRAGRKESAGP